MSVSSGASSGTGTGTKSSRTSKRTTSGRSRVEELLRRADEALAANNASAPAASGASVATTASKRPAPIDTGAGGGGGGVDGASPSSAILSRVSARKNNPAATANANPATPRSDPPDLQPSPSFGSSSAASGSLLNSAPPPVHTPTDVANPNTDRWGQFEQSPDLKASAVMEANAAAIATAAERAALREVERDVAESGGAGMGGIREGERVMVLPIEAEDAATAAARRMKEAEEAAAAAASPHSSSASAAVASSPGIHAHRQYHQSPPHHQQQQQQQSGGGRPGLMKSLSRGGQVLSSMIRSSTPRNEESAALVSPHSSSPSAGGENPELKIRMDALKVLEMADDMRRPDYLRTRSTSVASATSTSSATVAERRNTIGRETSALKGLGLDSPPRNGSGGLRGGNVIDGGIGTSLQRSYPLNRSSSSGIDSRFSIDGGAADGDVNDNDDGDDTEEEEDLSDAGVGGGNKKRRGEVSPPSIGYGRVGKDLNMADVAMNPDSDTLLIEEYGLSDEEGVNTGDENRKVGLWSSRYSVDRHLMALTGGRTSNDLLNEMDRAHQGNARSATGMFRAGKDGSGSSNGGNAPAGRFGVYFGNWFRSAQDQSREEYEYGKIYRSFWEGSSSSSGKKKRKWRDYFGGGWTNKGRVGGGQRKGKKDTVWMDVNLAERSSLPPPPHHSQTGRGNGEDDVRVTIWRHKQRQIFIGSAALIVLAIVIGCIYGTTFSGNSNVNNKSASATNGGGTAAGGAAASAPGAPISFYVVSDTPRSEDDMADLALALSSLPSDAAFVVHLGDISDPSVSNCNVDSYEDAASAMKSSNAPVFVLPGNLDWNDCPNPNNAWQYWDANLNRFEENFDLHEELHVQRQLERPENFAFVKDGVLFVGVNLVDGSVYPNQAEWELRHIQDVQWTEMNMGATPLSYFEDDDFRAVVIFGHAKPSSDHYDYFGEIVSDILAVGKPVLYMHADTKRGDGGLQVYKPFQKAEELMTAAEMKPNTGEAAGKPLRVTVEYGKEPWRLTRH